MAKIEIFPLCIGYSYTTLWVKNYVRFLRYSHFFIFCKNPRWPPNVAKIANLISKLNFYKLIPYPMDNYFTGRRDRFLQTPEKDILYRIPAEPVTECAFARWHIVLPLLSRPREVIASFLCLILLRPVVS